MDKTGTNPILVAAAYNAGSLRNDPENPWVLNANDSENPWGLKCYGNYFNQAAALFGDTCKRLAASRR
jgi:peptidoglycan L-alanyl-D-glutamate endopeptidase CwlK